MRQSTQTARARIGLISQTDLKKARMLRVLGAASAAVLAGSALGQTTTLFNDTNTTSTGLQTGGSWSAATINWSPTQAGASSTTQQTFTAGSIAAFGGAGTINVADVENIGGILYVSTAGGVTIGVTGAVGTASLTSTASSVTITNLVNTKQIIGAPWTGSMDIIYNYNANGTGGTGDLVGLSNWTGNLIINNTNAAAHTIAGNAGIIQLNSTLGNPNAVIKLGDFTGLGTDNPATFNGVATPIQFTLTNNVIANYNAVNNATVEIYAANGNANEEIVTYAGVISSPVGVTTNVNFGLNASGGRGDIVLANHNTYNGNTTITLASSDGLVQMGVDNALPSTTVLTFGTAGNTVAPLDLNGHSQTIAGLATGTTANSNAEGNIYNLFPVGGQETPVTLTIAGSANTVYKGDIGETDLAVNPFNLEAPFFVNSQTTVAAGTNISLMINGPGSLTLAPVSGLHSAVGNVGTNEYTGNTTVNGGTLIFGRTGTVANGQPGQAYTLAGGGAVTINNGGTLASVATNNGTSYVGGAAGTITLNSGAAMTIGGTNGINILSTSAVNFNSGATMNFEMSNAALFDQLFVNGSLTLDTTGTHTINFSLANGGTLTPGIYTLINASGGINGILGDNSNGFVLANSAIGADTLKLITTANTLQVDILAPALRWDPSGNGASNPPVQEGAGTWTDGVTTFVDLATNTEAVWSNSTTEAVIIGNDASGNNGVGGDITLGSNIVVNGLLTFGPIFSGFNYRIVGNGNTLTLGGGINVTSNIGSPSAEIDAPIILSASQTWEVDPGQLLDIEGTLSGGATTLTKAGSGNLTIESGGGSLGSLVVNAGIVTLGAIDSIGTTAPVSINGGGVQFSVNGTPPNAISIGANGGSLGATSGFNVTFGGNISAPTSTLTAIGAGNSAFNGNITVGTFANASTGITTLSGTNTITAINLTNGTAVPTTTAALGGATVTFNGGGLTLGSAITTLANNLVGAGTNTSGGNVGPQDILNILPGANVTLSGNITGGGDIHFYASGDSTARLTLAGASTKAGGATYIDDPFTLVLANPTALGLTNTFGVEVSGATLEADVDVTSGNPIRSGNNAVSFTKAGPGTLAFGGTSGTASVPGCVMTIAQGAVKMNSATALGGGTAATQNTDFAVIVNPGAALLTDFSGTRSGGAITLNSTIVGGSAVLRRDAGFTGETTWQASSAADVWTITGNGTSIIDNAPNNPGNVNEQLGLTVPFLVSSGSTLVFQSENTGGFDGNVGVNVRGPTDTNAADGSTFNGYIAFTLQAGATVKQSGPGALRFGRVTSQGIAIIGQGTPGNESLMQLGPDTWFTDHNTTANQINTEFVVDGSGSAGLRIEAAMNAVYSDPATLGASAAPGTSGLFGENQFSTTGSVNTIMSKVRMAALSNPYTLSAGTIITPSGTLTLAANDAAGATGAAITQGPISACSVTLALDNTTTSGNLIYQIAGGATFGNFAGLVVQRSNMSAGTVTARITGPTVVAALTLNNNTSVDMASDLILPVASPTVSNIRALIAAGYNGGTWDGVGINSSAAHNDATHATAVGYGDSNDLGITSEDGLPITGDSIVVKYTYYGDSSLDGKVDLGNDFNLFVQGFLGGAGNWEFGDYNYDGHVTTADFQLFIDGFAQQGGSLGQLDAVIESSPLLSISQKAELVALVPEPGSISLLAAASVGLAARRRRRL